MRSFQNKLKGAVDCPPTRQLSSPFAEFLTYVAPVLDCELTLSPDTKHNTGALGTLRNVGLQVAIVGWFYVAGGRGRSTQLVAATSIAHGLVAAPLLLLAAWKGGLELGSAATFALTDLLLGNLAWLTHRPRHGPK